MREKGGRGAELPCTRQLFGLTHISCGFGDSAAFTFPFLSGWAAAGSIFKAESLLSGIAAENKQILPFFVNFFDLFALCNELQF